MYPLKKAIVLGIILTITICVLISTYFFGIIHTDNKELLILTVKIEFWIACLILYLFSKYIEKGNFILWTEKKLKPLTYLVSIIYILGGLTIFMTGISMLINLFIPKTNNAAGMIIANKNIILFIFSALTAACTEELIFRGYLLPRFKILFNNTGIAIFFSSLIFGLAHVTDSNFSQMLYPFIIGLFFSFHYFKYRSLTTLIICHFLIDLILI